MKQLLILAVPVLGIGINLHAISGSYGTLPPVRMPPPQVYPVPDSTQTLPDGSTQSCHNLLVSPKDPQGHRVIDLTAVPTLGPNPEIWPGALLQGRGYGKGSFAPITIRRGEGTISVSGVNLTAGSQISVDLDMVSAEAVQGSIKKILSQKAVSTEAAAFLPAIETVYNDDQMAYALGVDSRFLNGLNGNIHIDSQSGNNYILLNFTQVYYTASFEDPETSYSVFLDGEKLRDPENQMGADNPPLYIKSVGYGRNVFFLVTSHYDADVVQMALKAAAANESDRTITAGGKQVTFGQVLRESTVSYYVQGGDAIATLGAMGKINGVANVYDAIRKVITDARLSQVTEFSQGIPVTYSLSYLMTRTPASMGFATSYNARTCTTQAKQAASFWLKITHVDDVATFEVIDSNGRSQKVYDNSSDVPKVINLDPWINVNETYTLRVTLYNRGGPSGIDFQFGRETFGANAGISGFDDASGSMKPGTQNNRDSAPYVRLDRGWAVGNRMDYQIRFNRGTGEVNLIQRGW